MSTLSVEQINDAVKLNTFTDSRFKTLGLSVDLLLPLEGATAAQRGILPALATRATRRYPDYTALSCRLAELYGASLRSGVRKFGEYQVLELSVSGIASRYAFGGEDMLAELSQLLFDALFDPLLDGEGEFPLEGFQQEKRQLLELKDAEYNDKMVYARRRCEELLFQGQRAGIDRCGSREAVQNLRREGLYQAWRQTLENARIEIFALGDCQPEASAFRQRFQGVGQPRLLGKAPYREPKEVLRVTEEQPVSQGKLSLAYRVDAAPQERMLFQLVNAVLGGTVSSKLFLNVREKLSLCYYASSMLEKLKGLMLVSSGIEFDKFQTARDEILAQLEAVRRGEIADWELEGARRTLMGGHLSTLDDQGRQEEFWLGQAAAGLDTAIPELAGQFESVTREQVAEIARRMELDTIYFLKGKGA